MMETDTNTKPKRVLIVGWILILPGIGIVLDSANRYRKRIATNKILQIAWDEMFHKNNEIDRERYEKLTKEHGSMFKAYEIIAQENSKRRNESIKRYEDLRNEIGSTGISVNTLWERIPYGILACILV